MSSAVFKLERDGAGVVAVRGRLTFETAAEAFAAITTELAAAPVTRLDLAGVEHSDSAGLACVLVAQAHAARLGRPLAVGNVPENMRALARVCEVDALTG